ncbi:unnamed protein product [Diabrotica balteata]|uniref:Saposin B-type domain-containing protein n=1 Tax=Diabrotica balteata TaxID=107213 RepID=A0A9N9T6V1_DIABA|nr:unnamed protein product [Diabrotica balteata]
MKISFVLAILVCVGLTASAQDDGDILCDFCVRVAKQIQDYVREGIPLDKVEEEVIETCHWLDVIPDLAEKCLKKYLPIIDEMYDKLNSTSPQKVCELLEFCVEN